MTQENYIVEQFDATNNKMVTRPITPLPTPKRIQAAKPITKGELTDMIVELRQDMGEQQKRLDRKDAIDKERTTKRAELSAKIIELIRKRTLHKQSWTS